MPDMRFAPPRAMRVSDRGGGLNQTSVRTYNERLVMSLLRQNDRLSRMELGQRSGLSAQTISVIVRALERDELLTPGEAQRGRVGPPSIPLSLNPDGAFAIGLKIGSRSADLVLVDFLGSVRAHVEHRYDWPAAEAVLAAAADDIPRLVAGMSDAHRERLVGVGIAVPQELDRWPLPEWGGASGRWSDIDLEAALAGIIDLPVHIQNDVTAAAGAEMMFGTARTLDDFVYFFVGARSESRLVLNHRIYAGRDDAGRATPIASLDDLAARLPADADKAAIWSADADWPAYGAVVDEWLSSCATSLVAAARTLSGFVSVGTLIIDGRIPQPLHAELCRRVAEAGGDSGAFKVLEGRSGPFAKAVGAAGMSFHSRYMVETVGLAGG